MITVNKNLTSLSELAQEVGVNKSKLLYYAKLGILTPVATIGKTQVFDRRISLKRIKDAHRFQQDGKKLKDIAVTLAQ